MALLVISFFAGILTVAAPCILPLLPAVLAGSLRAGETQKTNLRRPAVIALSLAASIIIFTLLLKATTTLLGVPDALWGIVAGTIIVVLGLNFIFPGLWENVSTKLKLQDRASQLTSNAGRHRGLKADILLGLALGPVFNSCSPTYAYIIAVVLPSSWGYGLANIVAYALGVAVIILLIGVFGGKLIRRLGWLTNPRGWFKRAIGLLLVAVGIILVFGLEKDFQVFVLDQGWYDPISNLEEKLR